MIHYTVAMRDARMDLCADDNHALTHAHIYNSHPVRSDRRTGPYDDTLDWDRFFLVQVGTITYFLLGLVLA